MSFIRSWWSRNFDTGTFVLSMSPFLIVLLITFFKSPTVNWWLAAFGFLLLLAVNIATGRYLYKKKRMDSGLPW